MRVARALIAGFGTAAALAALTACGPPPPPTTAEAPLGAPRTLASGGPAWRGCIADQMGADVVSTDKPRLDTGFVPVAAVICDQPIRTLADGREETSARERRADDVAALVAGLRLPDVPRTDDPCFANHISEPPVVLLDAQGRWVSPGSPRDACGQPRAEVLRAYEALKLTVVFSRVLATRPAPRSFGTDCTESWADMVWVMTTQGSNARPGRVTSPFPADIGVRLCVYRVSAAEQRTGKPRGDFESAALLDGRQRAQLDRALAAAPPAVACSGAAGRFALLRRADDRDEPVYVELDGCRRIMVAPANRSTKLAQADAGLIALLARGGE